MRRRNLRVLCVGVVVCALGMMALLSGCNDYNPNLGAAAAFSSQIGALTPSSRNAGCSGFTLDVTGQGFVDGATVQWNGQNLATTFETFGEMLATVPQANLAMQNSAPVSIPITVSVPGQTQGNDQSNTVMFTVNPPLTSGSCPSPPMFGPNIFSSGLSPSSAAVGATVTISGTLFGGDQRTSTVTFAGASGPIPATITSTSNWSATTITTTVPTGAVSGLVVVTVGSTPSNGVNFTVTGSHDVSAPTASALSASSPKLSVSVGNPVSASTGSRYVAFVATSADPATAGDPGMQQVFLRDTCLNAAGSCMPQTITVSAGLDGAQPNGPSGAPAITANGRFVAFASDATNLVADDANGVTDIFVRDTCLGVSSGCLPTTTRVSVGPALVEANGPSSSPSIGSDGRYIAFTSAATNLTLDPPAAILGGASVTTFVRDTCVGASGQCTPSTTRESVLPVPAQ